MKKINSLFCVLTMALCANAIDVDDQFSYPQTNGLNYVVTSIDSYEAAVDDNTETTITELVIPDTVEYKGEKFAVTKVMEEAFVDVESITSVVLPKTMVEIELDAFNGCTNLETFTMNEGLVTVGEGFISYSKVSSLHFPSTFVDVYVDAFEELSLTSLTVDSKNPVFNDGGGSNVLIATASDSLVYFAKGANIPSTVKKYGEFLFFTACPDITKFTIPSNIEYIAMGAFYGCNLTELTCEAIVPPTCEEACFEEVPKTIPLYVPAESLNAYTTADTWKDFTNIQAINTGIDAIQADEEGVAKKIVIDGQIVILRDGKAYNALGVKVE